MYYDGQNEVLWKHTDQSWPTIWGHIGGLQWVTKAFLGKVIYNLKLKQNWNKAKLKRIKKIIFQGEEKPLQKSKCEKLHGRIRELKLTSDWKDKEGSDQTGPLWSHNKQCELYSGDSRSCLLKSWKQRQDVIRSLHEWAVSRIAWRCITLKTWRPLKSMLGWSRWR